MDMIAYVYFALDLKSQRIKISCSRGSIFSVCPVTRVRSFGEKVQFLGCISVPDTENDLDLKRKLMSEFNNAHDEGDWFFLSQALRNYIQTKTHGHVCSHCAGETIERKAAANAAVNEALRGAFSTIPANVGL